MTDPVFVVGSQRSGTTWAANQISRHPEVAAVVRGDRGILESRFFSLYRPYFGDLSHPVDYSAFVEAFSASDYCRGTGTTAKDLYELYPADYPEILRAIMDRLAEEQGTRCWLEKSPDHALVAPELAEAFPDARFVAVRRDPVPVVASHLAWGDWHDEIDSPAKERVLRAIDVFRLTRKREHYNRVVERLGERTGRVLHLRYEDMADDLEAEMRRVADFLGLAFDEAMTETPFEPNTSFSDDDRRDRELSRLERVLVRTGAGLARLVPMAVHEAVAEAERDDRPRLPTMHFMGSSPIVEDTR